MWTRARERVWRRVCEELELPYDELEADELDQEEELVDLEALDEDEDEDCDC